jgi:hypothetical protein
MPKPYSHSVLKTKIGLVKFPPNVHGIYIEKSPTGAKTLTVRQNDLRLVFVLEEDDCQHLAKLLVSKSAL